MQRADGLLSRTVVAARGLRLIATEAPREALTRVRWPGRHTRCRHAPPRLRPGSRRLRLPGTTLSAWWVIGCRNSGRAPASLGRFVVDRHLLPAVAQHLGHPDQLANEPVRTSHEGFIEQPAVLREYFSDLTDVDVPEERDESQFAHDGQEALHDADAGERTRGHANKPYGLVDVLAETAVESVLQQPGKTVVVLGRDDDQTISGADGGGERRVLDRFARIVDRERDRRDVDDLAVDPGPAIERSARRRAAWTLARPLRLVPRITGIFRLRSSFIVQSSSGCRCRSSRGGACAPLV